MDDLLEYENLVYSIINKYSNICDIDDLYQVGIIGLIEAKKNYNNSFGVKFSSYAYFYILGEVNKYLRENKGIKIGRDVLKLYSKIEKTKSIMIQKLGREPTICELSLFLDISEDKLNEIYEMTREVMSLDFAYDDDGCELYSSIGMFDNNINPEILDLRNEVNLLPYDERKIITDHYYNDLTQSEISRALGISQVQVSRKETKILEKLRARL